MTGTRRLLHAVVHLLRLVLRKIGWLVRLPSNYPRTFFALLFAASIVFNVLDSFGLGEAGNQLLSDTVEAVAGPRYGLEGRKPQQRAGQDAIVVVLLDENALDGLGTDGLPLTYDRQARVLRTVAGFEPRAIFLDMFYPRAQKSAELALLDGKVDPRLATLAATLRDIGRTRPVIIGEVRDRPALAPLRAVLASPGADWQRGVHEAALAVDPRTPRAYAASGPADPDTPDGRVLPTAAVGLYAAWCAHRPGPPCARPALPAGQDMLVRWGFGASAFMADRLPERCRARGWTGVWIYVRDEFTRALHRDEDRGQSAGYRCAYADFVFYRSLDPGPDGAVVPDRLREHLRDRIVLIGVDLPSSGDRRRAPFYGEVPGVMVHAMALDNLIETGGRPALVPRQFLHALDELEVWQYLAAVLCFGFGVWVVPRLVPLYLSHDRPERREQLVAGATTCAFVMLGAGIVALGWSRQWSLATLVLGGFIPGGVLSVVFAQRSYAGRGRRKQEGGAEDYDRSG